MRERNKDIDEQNTLAINPIIGVGALTKGALSRLPPVKMRLLRKIEKIAKRDK